jgi:Fe-S-cluster containining protein
MTRETPNPHDAVTVEVKLSSADWAIQARVTVPTGPTALIQLLPIARGLADGIVEEAIRSVEERGERISCKKGCGACCRQLVPISEVDARRIRQVVDGYPEPRRTKTRVRFAEAIQRLEETGLLDKLRHRDQWGNSEGRAIGLEYLQQGVPCPFLEEESCSIYEERPITCREYLVTSPAEHCARPSAETVRMAPMALKVWPALARMDKPVADSRFIRWVPLILALEWTDENPSESLPRPGPELLKELLEKLTDGKAPVGEAGALPFPPAS